MCRSKASGSPRRCKAHAPAARKAARANRSPEQRAKDSAKRRARYLASKQAQGDTTAKSLEFSDTIESAENEHADWERWLSTLTPLQAELAQCAGGVEGLDERWGLTHTREVIWGPADLDELGVPKPEPEAGRVKAVTVRGRDVSVEWDGKGDKRARSRYVAKVRTWLFGLLDGWARALRGRDVTDSQTHPPRVGGVRQDDRGHQHEGRDNS